MTGGIAGEPRARMLWSRSVTMDVIIQMHHDGRMNRRVTVDARRYLPHALIYGVAAVAFLLVKGLVPDFRFSFVIKAVPALSLAVAFVAVPGLSGRERAALLVGAVLCGTGDVILDIDRVGLFIPGLAAFLVGHVGFSVFYSFRFEPSNGRAWAAAPVLVLAVGMAIVLIPRLGSFLAPVLVYLIVITAMTLLAVFSRTHVATVVGAFIFMISDALLALAKFVFDGRPTPMVTIPVYFIGLGLLGFGIIMFRRETQ